MEDDAQLTHLGRSLTLEDEFEQIDMIGISDDDGILLSFAQLTIGDIIVSESHLGGNAGNEYKAEESTKPLKTKADVMREIITKSKTYKHERQQQQEEDLEEIEKLDTSLGELQQLLRGVHTKLPQATKTQEMMSYDTAYREMVYDKRSKPADRTKTEEEIALEESERLQNLESERLKRMMGEETVVVDDLVENLRSRREGDDLDDDFVPDEVEEDSFDDDDDLDDLNDENNLAENFSDEDGEKESSLIPTTKRLRLSELPETQEIAYTYPCPATYEEMLHLIDDVPASSIPTIIERIEILHSTKLHAENSAKLQV